MVTTSNTFQQVSHCLPIALGVLQAPTVATSSVAAPILPTVEVTKQTPAVDPKIDLLIQAVAIMQVSIEKENFVSDVVKRLTPLVDEVYDKVLLTKYKTPNFT